MSFQIFWIRGKIYCISKKNPMKKGSTPETSTISIQHLPSALLSTRGDIISTATEEASRNHPFFSPTTLTKGGKIKI
jgi:hypothetical protein